MAAEARWRDRVVFIGSFLVMTLTGIGESVIRHPPAGGPHGRGLVAVVNGRWRCVVIGWRRPVLDWRRCRVITI